MTTEKLQMADVLREYDRYISIVADERNAMVFVDKNLKST